MNFIDYTTVIRDILIDFSSLYFLSYVILYRKYRNVEMFVSSALFNIFILFIVMSIVRTDFNMAVGFGLFALLSLVQLRSATFTKTEMAYLFGAVTLAVINGAGITDLSFILISNVVIVVSTWFIGDWSLEHSANLIRVDNVKKMAVTLDHIDENVVSNRDLMCTQLTETLGINVQTFEIKKIDYVRDVVEITVVYQLPSSEIPQYSDNIVSVSELVIDSERAPKTEGS
ncbi:MAG: DUF4956 domain-containing protein [Gammaproteobacteria bacterium]|nr:DUF4956 domain-containing protein [Gammaproteobacteria bacterium]MBT7175240.1 DUF4956 domain-containing protein [Gammaproteobacteria bacterium]